MSFYRETLVTARKRKRCIWCGEYCEAGEKRINRAGVYDGEFFSDCLHIECNEAMNDSWRELDNSDGEFEPMSMKRGKTVEESE